MFLKKKIKIEKLDTSSIDLIIKSICRNCEKNEYCKSAQKDNLCIRLDTLDNLLKNKIKINNLIIIHESSGDK